MSPAFKKRMNTIPGGDGWWKASTKDTYEEVADELLDKGLHEDDVIRLLESLYTAIADEYGG